MYRDSNGVRNEMSYRAQSRVFLVKASEDLEKGDIPMASENGWGAAVVVVKAMAHKRGWDHFVEKLIYDIVDRLAEETGDHDLKLLFASADKLQTNFYEDHLSRVDVEILLKDVARFVAKVERLIDTD